MLTGIVKYVTVWSGAKSRSKNEAQKKLDSLFQMARVGQSKNKRIIEKVPLFLARHGTLADLAIPGI